MFGIYRYILATFVVFGHFTLIFIGTGVVPYAVFSFYVLSGFLMTLIINNTYGKSLNDTKRYLLNRILRIYPPYWLILGITFIMVYFNSDLAETMNRYISFPTNFHEYFTNITLFGLVNIFTGKLSAVRLVPPAWALGIELIFYGLIPILARKKDNALLWMIISVAIAVLLNLTGQTVLVRYYTVFAATLPFSVGAYLFYFITETEYGKKLKFNYKLFILAMVIYGINIIFNKISYGMNVYHLPFYISIFVSAFITALLYKVDSNKISDRLLKADKFFGGLSYYVYLSHYLAAMLVTLIFYNGLYEKSLKGDLVFILLLLGTCNLISILASVFYDRYIQLIRNKVRGFSF